MDTKKTILGLFYLLILIGLTGYVHSEDLLPPDSVTFSVSELTCFCNSDLSVGAIGCYTDDGEVCSIDYNLIYVTTPVASPAAGTYTTIQNVALSTTTVDASIYYTIDGTTPTTSSTLYSSPISISTTTTLKVIAVKSGMTTSNLFTALYTISLAPVATPTASPVAGTYTSAQIVTLSTTTSGATIYYTIDGSTPTTSSTLYSSPISIASTTTLKAIAVKSGNTNSGVLTSTYTINLAPVATPTASPVAGTYTSSQSITLSTTTSGASIYYTTNGVDPTTSSTLYTTPVSIAVTSTLKAIAVKSGIPNSGILTVSYIIGSNKVATPIATPVAGTYTTIQTIVLTSDTPGATIYYTTNGRTPTTSSSIYTSPITLSSTKTIKAMAIKSGMANSNVLSAYYKITLAKVATPVASPIAGTYSGARTVTISTSTSGASIYYTTNGITPTTNSTLYTGAITITSTKTVKAIAVKYGMTNSSTLSARYRII